MVIRTYTQFTIGRKKQYYVIHFVVFKFNSMVKTNTSFFIFFFSIHHLKRYTGKEHIIIFLTMYQVKQKNN